jgi:UDP-N-acetylmuramoyl-tripeptide--D-alanyl-D-alanine ligase
VILAARRASLWARQVLFRPLVVAAMPLVVPAARVWRRLLVRTTFIGVTGSLGKTTTKELLAAILGSRAPTFRTYGNKNGSVQAAANMLRVRPWHRFAVFEMGISRPGQMTPMARLIRPHVAVLLGLAPVHTRGFPDRDAYAAEKAAILEHVPEGGTILLNGDDTRLAGFSLPAGRRVVRYGLSGGLDYQARDIQAVWPCRASFSLHHGGAAWAVATQLPGSHWASPVLAAMAAAHCLGTGLEEAARVVQRIKPHTARMEPVTLPSGAVMIRNDYSSSVNSFEAALRFLKEARARRRILVVSDISDAGVNYRSRRRQLGRAVAGWLDGLVLCGHDPQYGRRKIVENGMPPERVHAVGSIREAAGVLRAELRAGDLVLLAGRTTDHVARVYFAQFGTVACWRETCPKTMLCDGCWELGFKPEGKAIPPTAGIRV